MKQQRSRIREMREDEARRAETWGDGVRGGERDLRWKQIETHDESCEGSFVGGSSLSIEEAGRA